MNDLPILPMLANLTGREKEIIGMKCREGMTTRQIAERLGLSMQTVKNYFVSAKKTTNLTTSMLCIEIAKGDERAKINIARMMDTSRPLFEIVNEGANTDVHEND